MMKLTLVTGLLLKGGLCEAAVQVYLSFLSWIGGAVSETGWEETYLSPLVYSWNSNINNIETIVITRMLKTYTQWDI